MSLLIPSGHRKREAIELLRRSVRMFILPGAPGVEPTVEEYFAWMLHSSTDMDVQAKLEIDGAKFKFAFVLTSIPGKKG